MIQIESVIFWHFINDAICLNLFFCSENRIEDAGAMNEIYMWKMWL